jgi:hypothetical protein
MIKSIKNLKTSNTHEKTEKEKALFNALIYSTLRGTDWTQLPDCNLDDECIAKYKEWRQKVRRAKSPEEIKELENLRPEIVEKPNKQSDEADYQYHQHQGVSSETDDDSSFLTEIEKWKILEERYREALDVIEATDDNDEIDPDDHPFLKIECEKMNICIFDAALSAIEERRQELFNLAVKYEKYKKES